MLWDIAQPLYKLEGAPLNPARAASDVAGVLGAEGIVCAEPGLAGWWIGRTVPTTRLGSVAIPAAARAGAAVARALRHRLQRRHRAGGGRRRAEPGGRGAGRACPGAGPVVRRRDLGAAGSIADAADHRERAAAALAAPGVTILEVPIDYSPTAALIDAAGPLVAWGSAP